MENNEHVSPHSNSQFVLSYELLTLLRWLVDYDTDKLKKIIGKAVKSGLSEELHKVDQTEDHELLEEIQHSIGDFLSTLETLLLEVVQENVQERAKQQDLMPAVDHIDTSVCDNATLQFSLEKTTNKLHRNPKANAKELLFKEILKRWKPIDKEVKN